MHVIGITGGVGSGKTEVLSYIGQTYNCRILLADEVGHLVKQPGEPCYEKLVQLLGRGCLSKDKTIDKEKMAEAIFRDEKLRTQVNAIIHPAVEEKIIHEIEKEKCVGTLDFLFVEAALLLESRLCQYMESIWYIYAEEQVRRERLKAARNYPEEKITAIFASQKTEAEFRASTDTVIVNNGSIEETRKQIDEKLGEYL